MIGGTFAECCWCGTPAFEDGTAKIMEDDGLFFWACAAYVFYRRGTNASIRTLINALIKIGVLEVRKLLAALSPMRQVAAKMSKLVRCAPSCRL
mmetsp:Transcript_11260/g.28483  ORF Transcript_11260/g.28483 Transcript_11260/m.28483 type:complete len:94 (-) Transcript_11260:90-371(-)